MVSSCLPFQFTHPGRGATKSDDDDGDLYFVSIHAPREGCDGTRVSMMCLGESFNSRTPGGVRQCGAKFCIIGRINKRNLRLEILL